MKRICKVGALVLTMLLLCSCAKGGTRGSYFSYLDAPAQCSLTGTVNGEPFTAVLQSEGCQNAAGQIAVRAADFTLTYLSPAALAGVQVDYESATDTFRISLGELCAEGEEYAALGAVGEVLLRESAVETTRGLDGGRVCFETMDGASRTINAQGVPVRVSWTGGGRKIEVEVSGWNSN